MSFFRLLATVRMSSKSGKLPKPTKGAAKFESSAQSPVSLHKDGHLLLQVNVKPNAKESNVTAIGATQVHIQISAPPKDGEANEELISFLAKATGVKKSQLSVERGHKSRDKTVRFHSELKWTGEKLLETLQQRVPKDESQAKITSFFRK